MKGPLEEDLAISTELGRDLPEPIFDFSDGSSSTTAMIVTAVIIGPGNLEMITWLYTAGQTKPTRLASVNSLPDSALAMDVRMGTTEVCKAVRDGAANLTVSVWSISSSAGITLEASAAGGAVSQPAIAATFMRANL